MRDGGVAWQFMEEVPDVGARPGFVLTCFPHPSGVCLFPRPLVVFSIPKMMRTHHSTGAGRSPVPAPTHAFGRRRWSLATRRHLFDRSSLDASQGPGSLG